MSTQPDAVRKTVMDSVQAFLQGITVANGYVFDLLPEHVYLRDIIGPDAEVPAVCIVQRQELPEEASIQGAFGSGGLRNRVLSFTVGFVDAYSQDDPDAHAVAFMADIQRAIPYTWTVAVTRADNSVVNYPVWAEEKANAINIGPPLEGRVYGQVDYEVHYRTMTSDPRRGP
jgi:hypothetical protein